MAGECRKYEKGCGKCPLIPSDREKDISALNFREKKELFDGQGMVVTGPSPWIVECAQKSPVLKGKKIVCMPNMVDTRLFRPIEDRAGLRRRYGLPEDKKIILFGAADNGTENQYKGFAYLLGALKKLNPKQYHLAIFGNSSGTPVVAFPLGGILSQITHGENGYLAKRKEEEDLAEGIMFCSENSKKLGAAARKSAERFSFEAIGERYEKFLREICEKA